MTDFTKLAQAVAKAAPDAPFRIRQGVVVSAAADGTATVTIGGGTTQVAGVKVASGCCPVPGATCWIATDGRDLIVLAVLAPTGPAWATMRQSVAQTIATATYAGLDWTNRTETASAGMTLGNTGITVVVPGLYSITGALTFAANATGQRHTQLWVNGAVVLQGMSTNALGGSDLTRMRTDGILKLAVGDVINIAGYQSSGGNLATNVGTGHTVLRAVWIGPAA